MKLFLTVSLCLLFFSITSQTANSQAENVALNELIKNLEANPENPVNVTTDFMNSLIQNLSESSTRDVLQNQNKNLNSPGDFSFRQLYWDISAGIEQNPALMSNPTFFKVNTQINYLYTNTEALAASIKNSQQNYKPGMFISDPLLMNSLTNLTGSYQNAQAIGLGAELVADWIQSSKEQKAKEANYRKMAKLSKENLYMEVDPNLNRGLIDAYLGYQPKQMLTQIYRYDFSNGAFLMVDKGVLKYFNPKKGIVKELTSIAKMHQGEYQLVDHPEFSAIKVSDNDSLFYLYVGGKTVNQVKCENCLDKGGYIFKTSNGELTYEKSNIWAPKLKEINNSFFDKDGFLVYNDLAATMKWYHVAKRTFKPEEKRTKEESKAFYDINYLDKSKKFITNGLQRNFKDDNSFGESSFTRDVKYMYTFEKDSTQINLFWISYVDGSASAVDKTRYGSSMIQIANKKSQFITDAMVNEISGLAMKKNHDLFIVNNKGYIGKLSSKDYDLTDPTLPSKLRSCLTVKKVDAFDFVADNKYPVESGVLGATPPPTPLFPCLYFTPDEKHLVYIVKNRLFVINPENLEDVKSYTLAMYVYNVFFTKENKKWVINLQGFNECKFPVTKKYSLVKLSKSAPLSTTFKVGATSDSNKTKKEESSLSIADEIKKLKALLDEGIITKEEFDKGKKQLLEKK